MKIIDWQKKGNVVRFYLGDNDCDDYWGDDWDDVPYECNAERVSSEFIKGHVDINFPFDALVLEPCNGELNSQYSKEDMKKRKVPCVIVVPEKVREGAWGETFREWVGCDDVKRYYFGDRMEIK